MTTQHTVITNLDKIRNNPNVEFITYIPYAYTLTIFAIMFKPSWIIISILVAYVYANTFLILKNGKCKNLKDKFVIMVISLFYTISCIFFYYGIRYIYWKKSELIWVLFFTPLLYFAYIKLIFYIFGCNPFSNYHYGIELLLHLIQ
jgi:hypothetical protein